MNQHDFDIYISMILTLTLSYFAAYRIKETNERIDDIITRVNDRLYDLDDKIDNNIKKINSIINK